MTQYTHRKGRLLAQKTPGTLARTAIERAREAMFVVRDTLPEIVEAFAAVTDRLNEVEIEIDALVDELEGARAGMTEALEAQWAAEAARDEAEAALNTLREQRDEASASRDGAIERLRALAFEAATTDPADPAWDLYFTLDEALYRPPAAE